MATEIPWQQLTVLLTVAIASHFAFRRFKQPIIMGEVLIGIILGPTILGQAIGHDYFDPTFTGIFSALGAIVLLFLIGLDSDISTIYSKKNAAIAFGGVVLPWIGGYLLTDVMLPQQTFAAKVFIGATMVATSTAITAAILLELKAVKTDVGRTIMGAAVIDDVLGLIVLSMSKELSVAGAIDVAGLGWLIAAAVVFIALGIFLGTKYLTKVIHWADVKGQEYGLPHTGFTLGLGLTFFYAFASSSVGLHPIVGAFIAGAIFAKSSLIRDFQQGATYLGAIFTPIFFVSLGVQVDLWSLDTGLIVFGITLALVAIPTKVLGCWLPARLTGSAPKKSLAIGFGMAPRGEVGLVIASTALGIGVIREALYSITTLAVLLTTIIPPFIFRYYLRESTKDELEPRLAQIEKLT